MAARGRDVKDLYRPGETVKLVVRVRNAGKGVATFISYRTCCFEYLPTVVNDKGKAVALKGVEFLKRRMVETELQVGEEIDICEFDLALQPPSERGMGRPWTLYELGKFQIQFEKVDLLKKIGENTFGPLFDDKIATGKLELEVKNADEKKLPVEKSVEPAAKPTLAQPEQRSKS